MTLVTWPTKLRALMLPVLIVALTGCGRGGSGADSEETTPPAIVMSVSGVKVGVASMRSRLRFLGTTVAQHHLTLRAPAAGRIEGFELRNGDVVRRGQIVASIKNREIEAAENGLAVAQRLDPANAPALASSLRRNASPAAIAVTVQEDAVVANRIVSSGQMVAELEPIADLINPRSIYVEASAPIADLASVHPGMDAAVASPLRPAAQLAARVAAVSPNVNPGGATAPVRVEFTGYDRIMQAGVPTEVLVTTADISDAIVIPDEALFADASTGEHYVFVAAADGHAHRRTVTTGVHDGARTQIVAGLKPGQVVITSGGYALSDGLQVKVALASVEPSPRWATVAHQASQP